VRWLALGTVLVAAAVVAAAHGHSASAAGCGSTVAHFQAQPYERRIATPPAPSLAVREVSAHAFRFTWSFAGLPSACKPVALILRVRVDRHATPAFGPNTDLPVRGLRGSYLLHVPAFLHPVWGLVAALDRRGVPSTYAWARIAR
jgi:hypothetical protein